MQLMLYVCECFERQAQITGNSMTKVSSYLPLDRCLEGLNLLVQRLYGAKLVEVPMAPGESWAPDIKKIEVVHEDEGHLERRLRAPLRC